jgi:hypothetical protein
MLLVGRARSTWEQRIPLTHHHSRNAVWGRRERFCLTCSERGARRKCLLQLRVLRFGLFQDWYVGIGVFPEGEETFVGGEGPDAGGVGIGSLFTPRPTRFKRF